MRAVLQAVTFETLMSIPSVLYCCADHSKSIISVAVISPSQKEHKYIGARKATSGCPLRSQSALKLGPWEEQTKEYLLLASLGLCSLKKRNCFDFFKWKYKWGRNSGSSRRPRGIKLFLWKQISFCVLLCRTVNPVSCHHCDVYDDHAIWLHTLYGDQHRGQRPFCYSILTNSLVWTCYVKNTDERWHLIGIHPHPHYHLYEEKKL